MTRRYVSPLRYPGGKATMADWLARLADQCGAVDVWMEPFGGGAGAALTLLDRDLFDEAWIAETNPALGAFWTAVITDGHSLADRVADTTPTLELYRDCCATVSASYLEPGSAAPGELAFAALVVNRCSRSGMIAPRVGPIGGWAQDGRYRVADRFNGPELADRIVNVARFGSRLRFLDRDGIDALAGLRDCGFEPEVFCFVDPPYIEMGNRLYANGMGADDHARLAAALSAGEFPWVLTYDAHPRVLELYGDFPVLSYGVRSTAAASKRDEEYLVLSSTYFQLPAGSPMGTGALQQVQGGAWRALAS